MDGIIYSVVYQTLELFQIKNLFSFTITTTISIKNTLNIIYKYKFDK